MEAEPAILRPRQGELRQEARQTKARVLNERRELLNPIFSLT
jgi:hypothetical protein